ncbi:MAG: hypothetical protein L6V86_04935 [Treponema sp.]|nr:MAG: hypothetical protein L6V86_04935 [Treponema sp.]
MNILNDVVDKFVIVEADKTQRGVPKAFNFEKIKAEFDNEYPDKIIYIKATNCPVLENSKDWAIEYFQRNSIMGGVYNCNAEDLIMISDIDEIPNPNILKNLHDCTVIPINKSKNNKKIHLKQMFSLLGENKKFLKSNTLDYFLEYMSVALEQDLFYYYFNNKANQKWYGTVLCKYKNLRIPQQLRNRREIMPYVKNAGWHFSYMGGIEQVKLKLSSIIEGDNFKLPPQFSSENDYINFCLDNGKDVFGRKELSFHFIDLKEIELPKIDKIKELYPILFHQ